MDAIVRNAAAALALGLLAAQAGAAAPIKVIRQGSAHEALYDLAFEGVKGTAVGAFGTVLSTEDGGRTWGAAWSAPGREALFGVARRAGHCVLVGQNGAVIHADDCLRWAPAVKVTTARLMAVGMNRAGTAYAVGAFGAVLKSNDWGARWSVLPMDWSGVTAQGAEPHLYGVEVADDGAVTLVGEFELILRSTNGGAQWKVLHKGERSLFGIHTAGQGKAYAVGQSGAVLKSEDGGANWTSLNSGSSAILTGVAATDAGQVVATGINTIVASRNGGAMWEQVRSPLLKNAWHQAVAIGADGKGKPVWLVVGESGSILEVDN